MIRFQTGPWDEVAEPGASRLGIAHIEPFNGCNEMRLMRGFDQDAMTDGPHRVIVTARFATDSVWSKTVVIETRQNAEGRRQK